MAIVHGLAEHSERYDLVARQLVSWGYAVYCFDQRGHGESEGTRTDSPSFESLLDDVEIFLARVEQAEPELPRILLGHSMGGLEAVALLGQRKPELDAAVISAPALVPAVKTGAIRRGIARLLRSIRPTLRVGIGLDPAGLTHDAALVKRYIDDPRVDSTITVRLALELIGAGSGARASMNQIQVPLLVLHGDADPICSPEGAHLLHAAQPTGQSNLILYPMLLHEILNEPEWRDVLADMHAWIERVVPLEGIA